MFISDIDADEETFRCGFYIYMNWYITKEEYLNYIQCKENKTEPAPEKKEVPYVLEYDAKTDTNTMKDL